MVNNKLKVESEKLKADARKLKVESEIVYKGDLQLLQLSSLELNVSEQIAKSLKKAVFDLLDLEIEPEVSIPSDLDKGDFTTNIAMKLAKELGNPMRGGEKIIEKIREDKEFYCMFSKIELANPGFINFWMSDEEIELLLNGLMHFDEAEKKSHFAKVSRDTVIFEFGDPNPFKEPHIGHLRNFILGESLIRLLESQGNKVVRASYQGDVGLHVAKCIYGIMKHDSGIKKLDEGDLKDKVKALGKAYQEGASAYEADPSAKEEIVSINNKIYANDSEVMDLWEKGRKISLDHFEELYKKLGIKYDKYYFEKDVASIGKEIVEKNIPDVFVKDAGAVVFKGGAHTRVFLNSDGNPTYEAKDLGLAVLKDKDFPKVDESIIMTANEQADYFKVLLKALEKTNKNIADKTSHLSYGFINLRDGKMSSRKGEVVTANWLLQEVQKSLKNSFKEVPDDVLNQVSVGAIKWSMLKFSRESDISFSIEESIDLTGNSGPYMQYTYARISSILEKSENHGFEAISVKSLDRDLLALGRDLCQFEMHIKMSTSAFFPNILTDYLFGLAQKINSYYEKEKIIGSAKEAEKLALIHATGQVLKSGLNLLGIDAPEKI